MRNGTPVRLKDVAHVYQGAEDSYQAAWFNGKPAIELDLFKRPEANVIDTVDSIKQALPELRSLLPPGTTMTPYYDGTPTIRDSVSEVQYTLLISLGMVMLTMALFLRRWAPTLIAATAVPMSLAGAFLAMYLLRFHAGQPVAAGAGDRHRLRGRRRHRDDRERDPPRRCRHAATRGRLHRRARDRLHHRLDHRSRWWRCSSR